MTMTALRWFSSSHRTGHTCRVTGFLAGHAEKDLEQDSKVVLWVVVLVVRVVYNTQAARFGPLAMGLPSSLRLECKVFELNSICRLFMGGWVGAFHHPAKMMRPLTHHFAKKGALAKSCCPHT